MVKETVVTDDVDVVSEINQTKGEGSARNAHTVVRAAIQNFYTHYLHFVQVFFIFSSFLFMCVCFTQLKYISLDLLEINDIYNSKYEMNIVYI